MTSVCCGVEGPHSRISGGGALARQSPVPVYAPGRQAWPIIWILKGILGQAYKKHVAV